MIVKSLSLKNFRNYSEEKIEFDKRINIIYGNNAQGKTNILEAICLFSLGKSSRTKKDTDMIKFGEDFGEINISFLSKDRDMEGRIFFDLKKRKKIEINDIPVRKNSELSGNLNIVFFGTEYLSLIREGPKMRRKNLDMMICQLDRGYLTAVSEFKRLNEQKASLLKNEKVDEVLLSILNEKILELSIYITKIRYGFIKKIEEKAREIQLDISKGKEELSMNYLASGIKITPENIENLSDLSAKRMLELKDREKRQRECIFGPHRDDIEFFINGNDLKYFGSQGQQKTAILVQKIAEVEIFKEETGEYPILLLDDIMSELDKERQDFIINKINKGQIFITATDSEKFETLRSGKFLKIDKGRLIECTSI